MNNKKEKELNAKVLPCPFCGNLDDTRSVLSSYVGKDGKTYYHVTCIGCGASTQHNHGSPEWIVDMWNRRV